jgi:hypothetical protein
MGVRLVLRLHPGGEAMTLVPLPTSTFFGLDLSQIQKTSLTNAAVRMAEADAPIPESVRQDTAGTVHLTWHVLGCRIIVTLSKNGQIGSQVTTGSAGVRDLGNLVAFQVQLQEFFAL